MNAKTNRKEFLKWKRQYVTYRGVSTEPGKENGVHGQFGDGLYTAALSYKALAKQYGKVYFVINGRPQHPKKFNGMNAAEIFIQGLGKNTKEEVLKLGFDGIEVTGREMVNFTPKNVFYVETETELERFYETL